MTTLNSPFLYSLPCVLYCLFSLTVNAEQQPLPEDTVNAEQQQFPEDTNQQAQYPLTNFFYFGASLGINHYQHGCESWSVSCDKSDLAGSVFTGYQFNKAFAVELAYMDLGSANATYLEHTTKQTYTGSMTGVDLSALATFPINKDFSVFAKAGVFHWRGKNAGPYHTVKADGFSPTIGAGLTYQLSDAWQARVAYQYINSMGDNNIGGTNAHLATIGISYQFGRKKPKAITRTVVKAAPVILEEVVLSLLFDFDKSAIVQPDVLKLAVTRLTKYSQAKVVLRGHSDATGSKKYNLALSKRRVTAVSNYLMALGVNRDQISIEFFGSDASIIDNNKEEHRHLNRLVEVHLLQAIIIPVQEEQ